MPNKVVRAYVYRVGGSIDSYKVFPPVVILANGDEFELVNTVDSHDALLTIPDGTFDGPSIKKEKVGPKSKFKTQPAKNGPLRVAEYGVEVDGKNASGNSDPVIIIDP